MIQSNYLSLQIEEDVSIAMQEAMLFELRMTTNNPPTTSQPAIVTGTTTVHTYIVTKNWLFSPRKSTW